MQRLVTGGRCHQVPVRAIPWRFMPCQTKNPNRQPSGKGFGFLFAFGNSGCQHSVGITSGSFSSLQTIFHKGTDQTAPVAHSAHRYPDSARPVPLGKCI